jgi:hypothetical protein
MVHVWDREMLREDRKRIAEDHEPFAVPDAALRLRQVLQTEEALALPDRTVVDLCRGGCQPSGVELYPHLIPAETEPTGLDPGETVVAGTQHFPGRSLLLQQTRRGVRNR